MWFLRVGSRGRWCREGEPRNRLDPSNPEELDKCASDLKPRELDDGKISVYCVHSTEEAAKLATEWGMEKREVDENLDYVLIPDACFDSSEVQTRLDPDRDAKHALLRERHYLVQEVRVGGFRELAAHALRHADLQIERISRKKLQAERERREG